MVDTPTMLVPESELPTDTGRTIAVKAEGNDEVPENILDEYPEYWIG